VKIASFTLSAAHAGGMTTIINESAERSAARDDADDRSWGLVFAAAAPILLGAVLVPFRSEFSGSNAALALVIPVVIAAAIGGRVAGVAAALCAAASFDFFLTRPYLSLNMESRRDIETTVLLAIVGLIVGTVAAIGRRSRESSSQYDVEIHSIHRVAELAASGVGDDVVDAARNELTQLLRLRECRYETAPFSGDYPALNRRGSTGGLLPSYVARRHGLELPTEGAELPVLAGGRQVARFVLVPTAGVGASTHARLAAVVIADQVGATIANVPSVSPISATVTQTGQARRRSPAGS
jgi:hypothetical protein